MQATTRWLRKPASRWARIPAGVLLIIGGRLAILPVFGLWMFPLGLMLWRTTSLRCAASAIALSTGSSGAGQPGLQLRGERRELIRRAANATPPPFSLGEKVVRRTG